GSGIYTHRTRSASRSAFIYLLRGRAGAVGRHVECTRGVGGRGVAMWPPREEAITWTYRMPLVQPAITILLAAVGCAGLLQAPQDREAAAFGEWPGWRRSVTPRRGSHTAATPRRAAQEQLPTDAEDWSRWSDDRYVDSSDSQPAWENEKAICDVVLEEDDSGKRVCGPQVIIGGAMKCGTNTLASPA
ncbi:unnamed protein product, partial [Prorocentrum cordatum]